MTKQQNKIKNDLDEKSKVNIVIEATLDLDKREKTLIKIQSETWSADLRK